MSDPPPCFDRHPIGRLVRRLLRGSVVPFVGAGFSYGARDAKGFQTSPDAMPAALRRALYAELSARPAICTLPWCTLVNILNDSGKNLGQLAELGHQLLGARGVCETLEIARYAELRPEPSHRYLAYLVREGLIREVITTNYDCCIETAFAESLKPGDDVKDDLAVITSLEAYRQEAGCHTKPGQLLLYKINGCAKQYGKDCNRANLRQWDEAAERIILTERQLQNFRREQWARDLLRDRARTRNFLFSGFGSEEPQVRHTVLTLMEEFANGYHGRTPDESMDLPNAPFLQEYHHRLSFHQLQILVGFLDAHSTPRPGSSPAEARIAPVFRNVFAGQPGWPLAASVFFQRLFIVAFCSLVQEAATDDGQFALWLRRYTDEFRLWLSEFDFFIDRSKTPVPDRRRIWRHLIPLLRPARRGAPFPLPFWRLIYKMIQPDRPMPTTDFYYPLRQDPVLILVTMVLLGRLKAPRPFVEPFDLTVPGDEKTPPMTVRLVAESALQPLLNNPSGEPVSR